MKEKIIFKTMSGSKLYGTNSNTSDTDYKGVFLPDINDLILGIAPKHYSLSTGNNNEKNTVNDIDETYYSLQYFLELASKGETNAIDMLFAYTNTDAVIYKSEIWDNIINNIDKLLTKNIQAFIGYCKSQCIKYSIKGDKLINFNVFKYMLEKYIHETSEFGNNITLKECINTEFNTDISKITPEPDGERVKFINDRFGTHCYLQTAQNKEEYILISDVKFQLSDTVKAAHKKLVKVIASYGMRAKLAADANGADYKAISHCVRVLFQVEELLLYHKISFPLKHADFIKSIKYNTTNLTYDEIMDWINKKIEYINSIYLTCDLPEHSNKKWINNFILNCYKNNG